MNQAATSASTRGLKERARRGALWVTATSAAALPLAYYRNWILTATDADATTIGAYAALALLISTTSTFGIFGGPAVATNFLPKTHGQQRQAGFIAFYGGLSVCTVLLLIGALALRPGILDHITPDAVSAIQPGAFATLALAVVIFNVLIYCLNGLLEFRHSVLLTQAPLVAVAIIGTIGYFAPTQAITAHPYRTLTLTLSAAYWVGAFVAGWLVIRRTGFQIASLRPPTGFWRFSFFVHLNTISTFVYTNADQGIVLAAVGVTELGLYFVLLQCAQLIRFVPDRIGQVMLSSFAWLVGNAEAASLKSAYYRLSRMIIVLTTILALAMISGSIHVAGLFGPAAQSRYLYLVLLTAAIHWSSLGGVNSMLIMSKERTGAFLFNNMLQLAIQLVVSIALLGRWGVVAVIAGKAAGILSAQIGNFSIIRWFLDDASQPPPKEYFVGVGVVTLTAAAVVVMESPSLSQSLGLFIGSVLLFLKIIKFDRADIESLLGSRRTTAVRKGGQA